MTFGGISADVLVTVKAAPQPSLKYGDTSCVAGVRMDLERPELIRLYPVDFRWLNSSQQFKKYDVLRLKVEKATNDSRAESFKPVRGEWSVLRSLPTEGNWRRRHEVIGQVEPSTTCELSAAARENHDAASLGLVPVADISDLRVESQPPWTEDQLSRLNARRAQEANALIPFDGVVPRELVAPRFKATYRYRCTKRNCGGHRGQLLDWELNGLQWAMKGSSDEELRAAIKENFWRKMEPPARWTAFYVGNMSDPRKRHSFSVLGVYWPPSDTVVHSHANPGLF